MTLIPSKTPHHNTIKNHGRYKVSAIYPLGNKGEALALVDLNRICASFIGGPGSLAKFVSRSLTKY